MLKWKYPRVQVEGKSPDQRGLQKLGFRLWLAFVLCATVFRPDALGQTSVVTYHNDVARTGLNPNEVRLNPSNVNKGSFGLLFSQSVDGPVVGQPLYLPDVSIPGAGAHNVVYVATLHDTVYAFDADSNTGSNASPLWQVSFINTAAGVTTASGSALPCQGVTGYTEAGVVSTPVLDPNSGTLYVVAKTNENGTVFHRLHALDVTTGAEKNGGPVAITGTFIANNSKAIPFNSLHAMNRPALLLNNGIVYAAFGSNGCNDSSYGWVIAYEATTLQQVGIFNTAPGHGLGSIWHTGSGPAADSNGYIYASTAEAEFTGNTGGQDYGSSVLKLAQGEGSLTLSDYFAPYNEAFISQWDLDLSASGVVVLPDQPGSIPRLLVASGKQGTIYLLNRDSMGEFNSFGDTQIVQELPFAVGAMFSTPAYWNNTVYFAGDNSPIRAFVLSGGLLSTPPVAQSVKMAGGHAPTISANGNTNGILWTITGSTLWAFDATTLKTLYNTGQAGTRDKMTALAHFATQTVADGRVFVATKQNLMVYGLLPGLSVLAGNNQSSPVNTTLPALLQVQGADPYSGQTTGGVTVTFSDGGKGGVFGNPTAAADSSGMASTSYTFSKIVHTVTITATSPGLGGAVFTETATAGNPKWVVLSSGNKQSGPVATSLPASIAAKVTDQFSNGVPGVAVTFSDGGAGGTFSANPVTTDSSGRATTSYKTGTKAGPVTISAAVQGLNPFKFAETVTAGPSAVIIAVSGSGQTAAPSAQLPQALAIQVTDQYGNRVSGAAVTYSDGGAGGSFSVNPVNTDSTGSASVMYTAPPTTGGVTIIVSAGSASTSFTATIQ